MNIGVITTSRADFGVYLPMLRRLKEDTYFRYFIFAGGMHTDERFGNSYKLIEAEGFEVTEKVTSLKSGYTPEDIAGSMGSTTEAFASVFEKYSDRLSMVFVLGDRFEMFAAASALVPFNIPMAHLHGGETSLGAIDNKFRHAITCMADYHFTSNAAHKNRVASITGSDRNVYNVGAMGIDNAMHLSLLSPETFRDRFRFDISTPFILTTFHPETLKLGMNQHYVTELINALDTSGYKILCTLPNADTESSVIRDAFLAYEKEHPHRISCFENLGQVGYLTAMRYCEVMVGNTSSGIIEAEAFSTMVVNVGDRQKGRVCGSNVIHSGHSSAEIIAAISTAVKLKGKPVQKVYGDGNAAARIIEILKGIEA